jgi:hypothetical protein
MSEEAKQAERQIELWGPWNEHFRVFRYENKDASLGTDDRLGIEVAGCVIVKTVREWQATALRDHAAGVRATLSADRERTPAEIGMELALALGDTPEAVMRRALDVIAKSDPWNTAGPKEIATSALKAADAMRGSAALNAVVPSGDDRVDDMRHALEQDRQDALRSHVESMTCKARGVQCETPGACTTDGCCHHSGAAVHAPSLPKRLRDACANLLRVADRSPRHRALDNAIQELLAAISTTPSSSGERERAALHACEGLDTSDLAGNEKGWLSGLVQDAHRVERDLNSALRARCPGNGDGDDCIVECQLYEASEQSNPCPAGCCAMADEKDVRALMEAIDRDDDGEAPPSAIEGKP